ncbi:hypothetical protein EXIGLDRAFT_172209 [Exidia glandulosa HHB12029]|uniref:Uncharacterized protein n=1 Tax=Exidia glandulosa HHB12029 TaxID=1314781 RepID=A0A165FA16_EXIGL|nr:hypothetical protein EXIGLDRAFT_172209 [Exidia glandulosa HHB12029]
MYLQYLGVEETDDEERRSETATARESASSYEAMGNSNHMKRTEVEEAVTQTSMYAVQV